MYFGFEVKWSKCRLALVVLLSLKDLEQGKLLGSETSEDQSSSRDGGGGSASGCQDQSSGGGEGGGGKGVQQEDWLSHGHADQADGEGDSEKALREKWLLEWICQELIFSKNSP